MNEASHRPDAAPAVTTSPTPEMQTRIDEAKRWRADRHDEIALPRFQFVRNADGTTRMDPGHSDGDGFRALLCLALGSSSERFCQRVIDQLASGPGVSSDNAEQIIRDGLSFIAANRPQSELETLLLMQAWMTHSAMVTQYRRLSGVETLDQLAINGSQTVKLGKLYIQQMESLAKLRSAGKQVIEVQHVHVYQGGQAVVGNVTNGVTDRIGVAGGRLGRVLDYEVDAVLPGVDGGQANPNGTPV